ncbi:acyl-CoA-binding domain-containing protein 5-like isoform X2 [Oryza brachyantha]|uniref:acyl-CoA-binding domain-containing protein 5-like isoform X2 n=1 Tax=Oryza brachyantha TaxID=4533 RepID=UPI001ADA1DF3|nr:acyl-CoA-binding domain-containing protein 5-like isoform X2 [Oryza brachyantha]
MELFYQLLLTAVASLLVAFLLARLLAAAATASDPRREPDHGLVITREEEEAVVEGEEQERIIEVDEVEVKRARVGEVPAAEEWVEVRRASAAEGKLECLPEAPVKAARELVLDAVLEDRKEKTQVADERCDLAAAAEEVVGVKPRELGVEAVSGEVFDVALEEEKVQDVGVKQHDLVDKVAPNDALDTGSEKQGVPIIEAVEVKQRDDLGAEIARSDVPEVGLEQQGVRIVEAIDVKQQHQDNLAAPVEDIGAGLEERVQAIEAGLCGLTSEAVPEEVTNELSEKQEEVIEEKEHQLAAETAPIAIFDVALAETEELKLEESHEEAINVHEEDQSKGKSKCEPHLVDQQEGLASKVELAGRKTDNVEISHESSSNDKMVAELPEKEVALQGMPADEAETDMEFGEWEGIERTEVEKKFGAAAAFASSDAGMAALSKLDSDVQLQLQGLLKVAIDGPCYDSTQPLTLRPSSRAKWTAWQKLGNMHPETAMERYMDLLSDTIPGWMGEKILDTKKHEAGGDAGGSVLTMTSHTSNQHDIQGNKEDTDMYGSHLTSSPSPDKGQSSDIPAE